MHYRKIFSALWLLIGSMMVIYPADTLAEDWHFVTVRRSDQAPIDVDYDSIHQEDEYLVFDSRYPQEKNLFSVFSKVTNRIEKYGISCPEHTFKWLSETEQYENGESKTLFQRSVSNVSALAIPRGSILQFAEVQLCAQPFAKSSTPPTPTPAPASAHEIKSKLLPNGLNSVDWRYMTEDKNSNDKFWMNTGSIQGQEGDVVSFLGKFDYRAPQTLPSGNQYTTSLYLTYVNCRLNTEDSGAIEFYDSQAHLVETFYKDPSEISPQTIQKNSIAESAANTACNIAFHKAPTPNIDRSATTGGGYTPSPADKQSSELAPNGIHFDDWAFMGDIPKGRYYVKKDSIGSGKDKVKFIGGLSYNTPQQSPQGRSYSFAAELSFINCAAKTYTAGGQEFFDANGTFIEKIPASVVDKTPKPMHGETVNKVQDYVCKTALSKYDPAAGIGPSEEPEIAKQEPAKPEPAKPEPAKPEPAKPEEQLSSGTAWQISRTHLVTASHVIAGAESVVIYVSATDIRKANVIASDPANDIAIIRIEGAPLATAPLKLATKQSKLGSKIAVLGFPLPDILGAKIQATSGEISGLGGIRNDPRFYQISAAVQSGNSGGPVLNQNGEVIGVVSSKLNALNMLKEKGELPQNVNFAVKQSYLQPLIDSAGIELDAPARKINRIEDAINLSKDSVYLVIVAGSGH